MLLADPPGRDDTIGRERDRATENRLGHEDAFGMVSERPVTEIRDDFFRLVKPVVDADIVFDRAAPFSYAGKGMVIRMCHLCAPQTYAGVGWNP